MQAQVRIARGTRIDAVSQDVSAVTQASQLQQLKAQAGVYAENLAALDTQYAQSDQSMGTLGDSLGHISDLLVHSRNGTLGAAELKLLGEGIKQSVVAVNAELARTDSQGRPLYSSGLADAAHPALQVQPGVTLASEISLTASDQSELSSLGSSAWATNLGDSTDAARRDAQAMVSRLQSAVLEARSSVGARWQLVATYQDANQSIGIVTEQARSKLLDTDVAQSAFDLALYTAQLTAARSLFGRIQSNTLFDVLR